MYMQGTIDVEQVMDYWERHTRMLEWWYLKEYWRAKRTGDEAQVLRLYGKPLFKALAKYQRRFR
jgi:hypothetical protein